MAIPCRPSAAPTLATTVKALFFNFHIYISTLSVYVDAGTGTSNPVTLSVVTSGPMFPRNWKIRISQIPCSSIYRGMRSIHRTTITDSICLLAEEGCLQYFTGVAGQIRSFNYDPTTGLQLSNQDYSICIRNERNFCGVLYTQCDDPGRFY